MNKMSKIVNLLDRPIEVKVFNIDRFGLIS